MFKFHLNLLISQMGVVGWVAGLQPFLVKRDVLGFNLLLITFFFFFCSDKNFSPKFNERDGEVERTSRNGLYVVENGRPR